MDAQTLHSVSDGYIAATLASVLWMVAFPIVIALVVRGRLGTPWHFFFVGILTFFPSQVATRVPAVQVMQSWLGPVLKSTPALQWAWVSVLAITAGVFEEVSRYLAFRWLTRREPLTWNNVVFFGIGHGALESILFGAGLTLVTLIGIMTLNPETMTSLPPEQRVAAEQQLAEVASAPTWAALLGAWERMWAMALHVGFSVLVLQVFRRHATRWLWLAIAAHAAIGFAVAAGALLLARTLNSTLLIECLVAILGTGAIWTTWRLRDSQGAGRVRRLNHLSRPACEQSSGCGLRPRL
jgi:uncharacterized membrane protein YhfC